MYCLLKLSGSMLVGPLQLLLTIGEIRSASEDANYNWDEHWSTGNDIKQTREVGQYKANPWGFFDMHGNVLEWTQDWYSNYSEANQLDPIGIEDGSYQVHRGVLGFMKVFIQDRHQEAKEYLLLVTVLLVSASHSSKSLSLQLN